MNRLLVRALCGVTATAVLWLAGCGSQSPPESSSGREQHAQTLRKELQSDKAGVLSRIEQHLERKEFNEAVVLAERYLPIEDGDLERARLKARTAQSLDEIEKLPADALERKASIYRKLATLHAKHPEQAKYEAEVSRIEALQAEQVKVEQARKAAELGKLVKAMRVEKDELENITFYTDKQTPPFQKTIHLYIGTKPGSKPWLRLKVRYYADDWLFVEGFTAYADGRKFERPSPRYSDWERDNGSGSVWEWLDTSPSEDDLEMLRVLAEAKEATIRFNGQQYYSDYKIPQTEKDALKRVLALYESLLASS